MNDQLTIHNGVKERMTLLEIAKALNVDESTIRKYTQKIYPGKLKNGVKTLFSELEVTVIKLELQDNPHLGQPSELPKTDLEKELLIRQAIQFQDEKIQTLQQQLEQAKPAIDFHKQVGDSSGLHTVAEVAKMIGTGRNRLFQWLRSKKILRNNNEPYQNYIESGYFEVKENPCQDRINSQTFVTAKGLQWIQMIHPAEKLTPCPKCKKPRGEDEHGAWVCPCPHCGDIIPF